MPENNSTLPPIRVLHSVGAYLNISENWTYPQIVSVPGVSSRVICGATRNLETFPLDESRLYISLPPWEKVFGIPRICNALGRRIGLGGTFIRAKISRWKPQIIHAHFGTYGWESFALKKTLKCKLITSFYGFDAWRLPKAEPIWRARYQKLFSFGDVFLVEGPAMRHRLCELGCPQKKIIIQRIGVDLQDLSFIARNFSEGLKIIMVARFIEKKGLADGLHACALASSLGTRLSVTVIGDASNDDEAGQRIKRELYEIANRPELAGRVRFTGFLPLLKTRTVLKEHNVLLCPSKHAANGDAEGGSPVALTEAMATGLLCVGTNHCDIPEVILDNKTGFLCNEGDISGMADALQKVERFGEGVIGITHAAQQHIKENFSLPVQMKKMREIYNSFV